MSITKSTSAGSFVLFLLIERFHSKRYAPVEMIWLSVKPFGGITFFSWLMC
jgi:hypothetical protein